VGGELHMGGAAHEKRRNEGRDVGLQRTVKGA
jgi:hypothetical protein